MVAQHAGAGPRRGDDIIECLKRIDRLAGDGCGAVSVAGIVGGLAAADLPGRHVDDAARRFEQFRGRESDRGAVQIDQTGGEQADPGGGGGRIRHGACPAVFIGPKWPVPPYSARENISSSVR